MAVNTSYMRTGGAPTGLSDITQQSSSVATLQTLQVRGVTTLSGALNSASAISGGALTGTTLSTSGLHTATGGITITGGALTISSATFYPKQTATTSINSTVMADGELSIRSVSASSAVIVFRSGNSVYGFIADFSNL